MYLSDPPELSESEEEEDVEYMLADDMDSDDEYMLQIAHGWDFVHRGGQLQPYPSVPTISVPMPTFGDKVQVRYLCTFACT